MSRQRKTGHRRLKIRDQRRRVDLQQRIHMAEKLESRVAPGSMIVDLLSLIGHPMAQVQAASLPVVPQAARGGEGGLPVPADGRSRHRRSDLADQQGADQQSDLESAGPRGLHPIGDRDLQKRASQADHGEVPAAGKEDVPHNHGAREQKATDVSDSNSWFVLSTELVSDGLEDGLGQMLNGDEANENRDARSNRAMARGVGSGSASSSSPEPSSTLEGAHSLFSQLQLNAAAEQFTRPTSPGAADYGGGLASHPSACRPLT